MAITLSFILWQIADSATNCCPLQTYRMKFFIVYGLWVDVFMPCLFVKWTKISKQAWTEIWLHNQLYFPTPHPTPQSPKDLARKFAELGLSCKLPLEKKSLKDALNCDIMPLSQNNTEWSSYLALTFWIKVLSLMAGCCHRQVLLDNTWRKLLQVASNIAVFFTVYSSDSENCFLKCYQLFLLFKNSLGIVVALLFCSTALTCFTYASSEGSMRM